MQGRGAGGGWQRRRGEVESNAATGKTSGLDEPQRTCCESRPGEAEGFQQRREEEIILRGTYPFCKGQKIP